MRRWIPVALFGLVASLLAPTLTHAVPVQVTYDFDDSNATLAVTSPVTVSIPPQGTVAGDIIITFTGDDQGNILDGPATLDVFDLAAILNVNANIFGPITVTGPANAELQDPVAGTLAGTQLSFGGALGLFHAFGTVTCTGTPCGFAGLPSGVPTIFDETGSVVLPTLTLGSISGTLTNLDFGIGGIMANLTFAAPEVSREVIPEPSTALLVAVGVVGFGLRRRPGGRI